MTRQEHLYALIKSMSRTEKGYFKKLYADKGLARSNQYVALFDMMDNQKKYNEKVLSQHFADKGVFKQFSVAKNYLNSMILKSLRSYYSKDSVTIELNERIMNIEILYKRGLYDQLRKEIAKIEDMIDEHEAFHRFPELMVWKKKLLDKTVDQRSIAEARELLHDKELEMIDKARVFAEISDLDFKIRTINLQLGTVRNRSQLKAYQSVMKHPILRDEANLNSFSSLYYFHSIHSVYFDAIKDYNNIHYHTDCFVKLLEENPKLIQRNPGVFVNSSFNRLISLIRLNDEQGFAKALQHFSEIRTLWGKLLDDHLTENIWVYETNAQMWNHLLKGDYGNMIQIGATSSDQTGEGILSYPFNVVYSEVSYFYSYALFATGKFKEAIRQLNSFLSTSMREQREDIVGFAMILNLMCHYELGNLDYVESSVRSTYRYLLKLKKVNGFEKALISFFRKLLKQNRLTDLSGFMDEFRSKLKDLEGDMYERTAFEYLDLISWLTSHIDKKPFAEVATQRTQGTNN